MEYRLEHIGITVNNLNLSIDWYKTNFGFELITPPSDKPKLELHLAKMKLGDFYLEIIEPYNIKRIKEEKKDLINLLSNSGTNHIALSVDDIGESYNRLKYNSVELVTEIMDSKYFFCRDPSGVLIEVRKRA
jgi:catechol 2,3-dioxygenase-like lactoylglutathione lyase family enzyme